MIDVAVAEPGPGQVRIEVRAVGVNPFDHKMYSGAFGTDPANLPMRLGAERQAVPRGAMFRISLGQGMVNQQMGPDRLADTVGVLLLSTTRATLDGLDLREDGFDLPAFAVSALWQRESLFDEQGLLRVRGMIAAG